jgi:hypothetical protein
MLVNIPKNGNIAHLTPKKQLYGSLFATFFRLMPKEITSIPLEIVQSRFYKDRTALKGRYRTLWAKSHPEVKTAQALLYMKEKISKEAVVKGHAAKILQRHHCLEGIDKTGVPTATNQCVQVRQNCPHINNTTIKDTIKETTAPPSPLPAGGQAPAVLDGENQAAESVNRLVACGKLRPPSY